MKSRTKLLRAIPTLVIALASIAASADTISGTTNGFFNTTTSTSLGGLTYTPNTAGFSVMNASDGTFAVGGLVNNLGTFAVNGTNFNYNGNAFTLQVMFTSPSAFTGTFMAALSGTVTSTNSGGANIDFSTTPQVFTLPGGRTLSFWANSLSLTPTSGTVALTGRGVLTPTPEPTSFAALGIGLCALARRRQRARSAR